MGDNWRELLATADESEGDAAHETVSPSFFPHEAIGVTDVILVGVETLVPDDVRRRLGAGCGFSLGTPAGAFLELVLVAGNAKSFVRCATEP